MGCDLPGNLRDRGFEPLTGSNHHDTSTGWFQEVDLRVTIELI